MIVLGRSDDTVCALADNVVEEVAICKKWTVSHGWNEGDDRRGREEGKKRGKDVIGCKEE